MITAQFDVTGMSCSHCERAIEAEVRRLPGVRSIDVSASTGRLVIITDEPVDDEAVLAAVDEAGYQATRA